jgi:multimeric flavodoxin WrbA
MADHDYSDLSAIFVNCTLKRSPEASHSDALMDRGATIMRDQGVRVDTLRFVDHDVAPGVFPDMREHGWKTDDWPEQIWPRVRDADILVMGSPLWLGESSSVARQFVERLYAMSTQTNDRGQPVFYGKVAGVVITGNEDGVKNAAKLNLYAFQHLGYTIPPAAETGWIGEIGPGPSYLDEGAGTDNDYTQRTSTTSSWNLLHLARMLKDAGGLPARGNILDSGEG